MRNIEITVVAFGIARDIIGGRNVNLMLKPGMTVSNAMDLLKEKYPAFHELSSIQLAVNESYVSDDYVIGEKDELVIIPPVSGG